MATSDSPLTGIYFDQHQGRETTMHVNTSSVIDVSGQIQLNGGSIVANGGSIDLTSGSITMPGALRQGYIPLGNYLFNARQAASGETISSGSSAPTLFWGGLLMPDGAPSLSFFSTGELIPRVQWASAIVVSLQLPPVAIPQDLSTAGGLTIGMFGETVGTASAADAVDAVQIKARFAALTSASDADVGATAPVFTSTPSWSQITIASGSITTNTLSIQLTPQAHAARAINVYDMRAIYQKKTTSST